MRIRPLGPGDPLDDLTTLLHRAYAPLGAMGLRFVATHQPVETTRRRLSIGRCFVAEADGRVVGTIHYIPASPPIEPGKRGAAWYERADVAKFGQLGVEPAFKGLGIGRALMDHVEGCAREDGAAEIACDTARPATHLLEMYLRRGYREVDHADWRPHVNYTSVVLSLALRPS